jgi:methylmalonyl-CoA carboxyltransferase large subunit
MAVLPEEAVSQHEKAEAVTPEILVVIAAAVTAFLGKKVRIRSAKVLQSPYEIVNPWSQQGRVFVQASHNLRSRG